MVAPFNVPFLARSLSAISPERKWRDIEIGRAFLLRVPLFCPSADSVGLSSPLGTDLEKYDPLSIDQ
ncbi:hypothetical protein M5K25_012477 [Dendrobium thyrsiflorum]|uniref:Uncharacterized protein n=1 Tax=Dendrobium thyrsiflorum TaxID=117978 RepID=A0ABD0UX45_DENTH